MPDTTSQYPLSDLFKYAGGKAVSDPGSDPELQYFLSKGYLTPQASGGEGGAGQTIYSYDARNIPKSSTGQSFGDFWTPGGISGVLKMIDPSKVTDDPNFGKITSNKNQYQEADFMSKYGQPLMMALAGGAFGSLTSMFGGGLGGLGNTIFKTIGSEILSGGQNPLAGILNMIKGNKPATTATPVAGGGTMPEPLRLLLALIGRGKTGG